MWPCVLLVEHDSSDACVDIASFTSVLRGYGVCFPSTYTAGYMPFCHFIQGSFSALFSVSIVACMWYAYVLWEYFFYNCLRTQRSSLKLISIVETRSLVVNFFYEPSVMRMRSGL